MIYEKEIYGNQCSGNGRNTYDRYTGSGGAAPGIRAGDEKHPDSGLALLLSNGEDGEKVMSVGVTHANETWHEITGSYDDEIVIGDDGKALFRVHGGKLAVWVKK